MIQKTNFTKDISFLINRNIYEYDISKANINILLHANVIDNKTYTRLYNASREERQKEVGIMILKDSNIYNIINTNIKNMRNKLIEVNNIYDDDILSAKNDALFIIDKKPKITKFDNIEFVLKNVYTSFYKIDSLELYYFCDTANGIEKLDVKGIADNALVKHNEYLLDFFKALFETIQYNINDAVIMLRQFYTDYINNKLDVGYYRNFDSSSMYTLNVYNNIYNSISPPSSIEYINKDYNLNILRDMWQIVSHIVLNKK